MIKALLLAAGESLRMGAFKQLLPVGGKSFVECCVDALLASLVDEVVVVIGHRADEVRNALGNRPVSFVHNPDYREGMSSSVIAGMRSLDSDVGAALIALGDQPTVETEVVNAVITAYLSNGPLIVVPRFGGKNGHPVLLDMVLKDEVLAIDRELGLKQVVHGHKDETLFLDVKNDSVVKDFDYPEDYEAIKQHRREK